jgi:hypothetical protein
MLVGRHDPELGIRMHDIPSVPPPSRPSVRNKPTAWLDLAQTQVPEIAMPRVTLRSPLERIRAASL